MASIEYAVPIAEKPHVLHVGLRVTAPDGDVIQEVPVRAAHYQSLTAAKKLAYVQQAAEYHHPAPGAEGRQKRLDRRVAWDADDKAAEEAKFVAKQVGLSSDGQHVQVQVRHQGLTVVVTVPVDVPDPEQSLREAWQQAKAEHDTANSLLDRFNLSV